jgi:hypothetical protein
MKRLLVILVLATACTQTYDYDPATAGDQEGSAREPRAKTSSQFLRTVFADLLGRAPASYDFVVKQNGTEAFRFKLDEETQLVTVLDGIGDSTPMRALVVNGLLHSAEVTIPDKASVSDARTYIHDQFTRLLGREPNVYELAAFVDAWNNDPAVGPRTIIRALVGSREYQGQ